jgi:hypothetical protein
VRSEQRSRAATSSAVRNGRGADSVGAEEFSLVVVTIGESVFIGPSAR